MYDLYTFTFQRSDYIIVSENILLHIYAAVIAQILNECALTPPTHDIEHLFPKQMKIGIWSEAYCHNE